MLLGLNGSLAAQGLSISDISPPHHCFAFFSSVLKRLFLSFTLISIKSKSSEIGRLKPL